MKSIDNYINERLNPRHLGHAGEYNPIPIQETLAWEFKYNNRKYVINSWGWQYVIIKDRTEKFYLVFWSPESSFVFLTDSKDKVFIVMSMKPGVTSQPEFYQDIIRYFSTGYPIKSIKMWMAPEQLEIDDAVGDIVDDFYQIYK